METKKCTECGQEKTTDKFRKRRNLCKECVNKYERERIKNQEKKKVDYLKTKICEECGQEKTLDKFSPRKDSKDGVRTTCKECLAKYSKEYRKKTGCGKKYYEKNKDKNKENCAKYYQENREEIKKRTNEYYHENKEELRPKAREYQKRKMKESVQFRMTRRLRNRLWYALKNNTKHKPTLELLGCSIDFLKGYLESKFTEGMNWEKFNEGLIHIDHIKPCASFDLTSIEQQKECFHYSNLQPLWALDNIKKGSKNEAL